MIGDLIMAVEKVVVVLLSLRILRVRPGITPRAGSGGVSALSDE